MSLIPNVPPKSFTLSAIIVGYLLLDDTTANEQNALGNWLMLVAQVLCTNAFYKQVEAERANPISGSSTDETVHILQKMVNALNEEIKNIEKRI